MFWIICIIVHDSVIYKLANAISFQGNDLSCSGSSALLSIIPEHEAFLFYLKSRNLELGQLLSIILSFINLQMPLASWEKIFNL